MANSGVSVGGGRQRATSTEIGGERSPEHYLRLLLHRKWLVVGVFLTVSTATFIYSSRLPNIYTSETVILVDPQKVPEAYVKSTVTGDVRNRLGTLSQQILSATRLQKIIETLNLYPEERKKLAREDVIARMRSDVTVNVVTDFGATQDLQAFRIGYNGENARLVAQVTNELASLFIEENLKAREQQASGTNEFLENQLQEARKALELQETKIKEFKLSHIGEMPEQQSANLQILGQLQAQLQFQGDALNRAEQQKAYLQSMASQSSIVLDLDDGEENGHKVTEAKAASVSNATLSSAKARLEQLLSRYTEDHPDIRKLKKQIADEEARAASIVTAEQTSIAAADATPPAPAVKKAPPSLVNHLNPVLQSQLNAINAEIATHKEEMQRLSKSIASYGARLEAIPLREQQMTQVVRDYEISKGHYSQLLEKQLGAETATQLEIRQKGEKFEILDPGQAAERPSRPNRVLINSAGALGGLILGMLLAMGTEFLGMSVTSPQDVTAASGLAVLEVIPVIQTQSDRRLLKRRIFLTTASAICAAAAICGVLFYRSQM